MAIFSVETYSSGKKNRRDTALITQAHKWAGESPDATVEIHSGHGWVLKRAHYTPKHPVPDFEAFKKWARAVKVKKNPKKRRSAAQRAATARMLAANKARKGRPRRTRSVKKRRAKNPRKKQYGPDYSNRNAPRGNFQVAAVRNGRLMFLSGLGLTDNRSAASNYGSLAVIRKVGAQLRKVGSRFGISKVAIVTTADTAPAVKAYLLGKV